MYQKIAKAMRKAVTIHSTMSLLRLFSCAMRSSTPHLKSRIKCRFESHRYLGDYGFLSGAPDPTRL